MKTTMTKYVLLPVLALVSHIVSAQVTFDAKIDSLNLFIGQQTAITLDVSMGAGQKLELPPLKAGDQLVPNVEVVEISKPDTTKLNGGKTLDIVQRLTVTAWDSAFYYLPPFQVKVDGQTYESKSLALNVYTIDVDTLHLDAFFPPNGVIKPPFVWDDFRLMCYVLLAALLLLAASLFLLDRARKGKPIVRFVRRKKVLPPHQVAMSEIERIKAERKWTEADSKEYYTLLTDTLRVYIQNRYGFSTLEMTSAEIIERLMSENDEQALGELREIFRTADLVKFAKYSTMINENDANLVAAVEYINQTKQEPDPNAKQEPEIIRVTDEKRLSQVKTMRWVSAIMICIVTAALAWVIWRFIDLIR
ncbi:MAG: BatD family protein [Bacteroidaceae bacterium]|nr:BatD family protein [Bacteroidaceae bacterium]